MSIPRVDPAGWPFIALGALPALGVAWFAVWPALGLLALPVAVALFFRDPERHPPAGEGLVLAPADGRVMQAGHAPADQAPGGDWLRVTIFLSLLDVHINRTPVGGRVIRVLHRPGSFRAAFHHGSHRNEQSEVWVESAGQTVVFRQVVGLLARRVVCRVGDGDQLAPGARIGLMKFGSRMDVFLPTSAALAVEVGASVRAGETVIARLARGAP